MKEVRSKVRAIAFYLPQYHPILENDQWWGKGFTEWRNVTKAKSLFPGHYQPHLPADLGFYDLRVPETRQAQADLAAEYGIYGFCYYHYWFNGKRLLERPFNEVLASGEPRFPFCLCWANENWTRAWDGQDYQVLVRQNYSAEDDVNHIRWLINAFRDERYIRVDGKPIFLVYRVTRLPNPKRTASIWREEAQKAGIGEILLCRVESFVDEQHDPAEVGFDCTVEFQPDWSNIGGPLSVKRFWRLAKRIKLLSLAKGLELLDKDIDSYNIYNYSSIIKRMLQKAPPQYKRFPCVTPSWDNSARRKNNANIFVGSTPKLYGQWLSSIIEKLKQTDDGSKIIFINAWNEWGEGNHLEPCQRWGREYLEATRKAVLSANNG